MQGGVRILINIEINFIIQFILTSPLLKLIERRSALLLTTHYTSINYFVYLIRIRGINTSKICIALFWVDRHYKILLSHFFARYSNSLRGPSLFKSTNVFVSSMDTCDSFLPTLFIIFTSKAPSDVTSILSFLNKWYSNYTFSFKTYEILTF